MEAKISVHCEGIEDDATETTCWQGVFIDGATEGAPLDASKGVTGGGLLESTEEAMEGASLDASKGVTRGVLLESTKEASVGSCLWTVTVVTEDSIFGMAFKTVEVFLCRVSIVLANVSSSCRRANAAGVSWQPWNSVGS